ASPSNPTGPSTKVLIVRVGRRASSSLARNWLSIRPAHDERDDDGHPSQVCPHRQPLVGSDRRRNLAPAVRADTGGDLVTVDSPRTRTETRCTNEASEQRRSHALRRIADMTRVAIDGVNSTLREAGTMSAWCRGLLGLLVVCVVTVGVAQSPAFAAAVLEIKPITWDIIGLDSNDPSTGPDTFPVGARVCNTGNAAATNVVANLVFDTPLNSFVHLEGNA